MTYGGGGMPSFGGSLSASEIQALATWVSRSPAARARAQRPASGLPATAGPPASRRDLKKLGFFHGPVTGLLRPAHDAAVKRFQRSAGLTADGIWGPKSASALRRRL